MFGSKTAPQITDGFIKNWYYYTVYGSTRNGDFRSHLWGTHDQHPVLSAFNFSLFWDIHVIDVIEAVFQLSYTFVHYTLIDRFDRDVELRIIRIGMEF